MHVPLRIEHDPSNFALGTSILRILLLRSFGCQSRSSYTAAPKSTAADVVISVIDTRGARKYMALDSRRYLHLPVALKDVAYLPAALGAMHLENGPAGVT